MRHNMFMVLRSVAIVAAMAFAFAGMMVSPASAQVTGTCQIVSGGDISTDCDVVVDEANQTCTFMVGDDTFQDINTCARILQGQCPFQMITEANTTIQIQCKGAVGALTATDVPATATDVPATATDVPPTATATDVPSTATDVPAPATDVPPTGTDVPPTATATGTTPVVTATAEPTVDPTVEATVDPTSDDDTDVVQHTDTNTDTDTEMDTDDIGGQGDDDEEVVTTLPSTGQGPDNGQGGAMALLSAMSMLMAILAFAWQRRQPA